jgi:hypothetical protein
MVPVSNRTEGAGWPRKELLGGAMVVLWDHLAKHASRLAASIQGARGP